MFSSTATRQPSNKKQKRGSCTSASAIQRYPTVQFVGDEQKKRFENLSKRKFLPNKYVDFDALELLHIQDAFQLLLDGIGWSNLMHMNEPSYALLTCEFLSSFVMVNEQTMSFRIANTHHQLTKSELADMFGWKLMEQLTLPRNFANPFWQKITLLPDSTKYESQHAKSSDVIKFELRYLSRLLSYTIYGRDGNNNIIQKGELELMYRLDAGLAVDWTSLLIKRFLYQATRENGALVIGGFVTRIAEKLGVFDRNKTNLKVEDGWPTTINKEYLLGMHMVQHDDVYGLKPLYHERRFHRVEHQPTLEEQVVELKQGQRQLLENQANMTKQMDEMFAFIKQHLPRQAS